MGPVERPTAANISYYITLFKQFARGQYLLQTCSSAYIRRINTLCWILTILPEPPSLVQAVTLPSPIAFTGVPIGAA